MPSTAKLSRWALLVAALIPQPARAESSREALRPLIIAARISDADGQAAVLATACSKAPRCGSQCAESLEYFGRLAPAERVAAMVGCVDFDSVRAGGDARRWVIERYLAYLDHLLDEEDRRAALFSRQMLACARNRLGFEPRGTFDEVMCKALLDPRHLEAPAQAVILFDAIAHVNPDDQLIILASGCTELPGCGGSCAPELRELGHMDPGARVKALAGCKAFSAARDAQDLHAWILRYVNEWIDRDLKKSMTGYEQRALACARSRAGDGDPARGKSLACAEFVESP